MKHSLTSARHSTNGDNEVWQLAKDADHYNAMVTVMRLRENLRSYVADLNAETAATGMPMVRGGDVGGAD